MRGRGRGIGDLCLRCTRVPSYLESVAGAALTESGDAVQIVGGDGLILLLDEAERREVEAGPLAVPILQHCGELLYGAPFNKRRTSQVPHLHITRIHTGSVLMIERQGGEIKTWAPFGFRGSCGALIAWKRGKPVDHVRRLKFKVGLLNPLSILEGLR